MWRCVQLMSGCLLLAALTQCGKSMNQQMAESINDTTSLQLKEGDIEVLETHQSGNALVAEVKVRTALKFVKEEGRWELDEIRLGDRRWEKASHVMQLLEQERTQTTLHTLGAIDGAIRRYQVKQGRVPQVADFRELIDVLTPEFLDEIVRLDAWSNPLAYRATSATTYSLSSAGADGMDGSGDDVVYRGTP